MHEKQTLGQPVLICDTCSGIQAQATVQEFAHLSPHSLAQVTRSSTMGKGGDGRNNGGRNDRSDRGDRNRNIKLDGL